MDIADLAAFEGLVMGDVVLGAACQAHKEVVGFYHDGVCRCLFTITVRV